MEQRAWGMEHGAERKTQDLRSKKQGTGSREHGTWNKEHGAWNIEHRVRNMEQDSRFKKQDSGKVEEILEEGRQQAVGLGWWGGRVRLPPGGSLTEGMA